MPPTDEIGWLSEEDHDPLLEESTPVAKLFPKEVDFFRRYWIDLASNEGYYIRSAYFDRVSEDNYLLFKWRPAKYTNRKNGRRYFSKFDEAARRVQTEKHLNWLGYLQRNLWRYRGKSLDKLETALWLGTLTGPQTCSDAIDFDSHTIVGFYSVPAQAGAFRELPVPKCDLAFFQAMKRLHAAFPDRTWMTTSANLGKCLWQHYERPVESRKAHDNLHSHLVVQRKFFQNS